MRLLWISLDFISKSPEFRQVEKDQARRRTGESCAVLGYWLLLQLNLWSPRLTSGEVELDVWLGLWRQTPSWWEPYLVDRQHGGWG